MHGSLVGQANFQKQPDAHERPAATNPHEVKVSEGKRKRVEMEVTGVFFVGQVLNVRRRITVNVCHCYV